MILDGEIWHMPTTLYLRYIRVTSAAPRQPIYSLDGSLRNRTPWWKYKYTGYTLYTSTPLHLCASLPTFLVPIISVAVEDSNIY